jgi:hypothetical protein
MAIKCDDQTETSIKTSTLLVPTKENAKENCNSYKLRGFGKKNWHKVTIFWGNKKTIVRFKQ